MDDTGPVASALPRKVTKRWVFYVPGYDPLPPRRYRELYRTESAKQAEISGYEIETKPAKGDRYGWMARGTFDEDVSVAKVEVLYWADLVRNSMQSTVVETYLALVRTAWIYISTGTLGRLMMLRRGPVIAALYPVMMLLLQLFVAIAVARTAGGLLSGLTAPGVGWILGLPLFVLIMRACRKLDHKLFAYYLMHDYAYSAGLRGRYPEELETRLSEFEDVVTKALGSDADEVLIVGHSSGAHLAVSLVADLVRSGRVPANGPALGLLTLGHVIPMISFLPDAGRLRHDLMYLSDRDEITWVDVTAPGDGCSFALCDPVAVTGVGEKTKRWPLVFSAAFTQTLSPEALSKLKHRYFRLHFQYLCAFDQPKDYDYFAITAGPVTLSHRYAGRKPSVNRIDIPVSKYRSIAA